MFHRAGPIGNLNVDWPHAQAMPLRIFYQHCRRIKTHRLIVQNGAGKRGQVFHFEVCRGIRNQREAGSVRLRKSIQRKRADVLNDVVLRRGIEPVGRHAGAQLAFEIFHSLPGSAHPHGASQLFGFRAGEVGDRHRHAQQLFLKQRNAKRALQHRFQRWMRIGDRFLLLPPPHVGVHHLANDGPGPNNRHLHDEVVEPSG